MEAVASFFATISSYGFLKPLVLICWRSPLNVTREQKNIYNIFISNHIVIQIGLQSETYIPRCVFGLFFFFCFFCDKKTWLHGIFYWLLVLLLCSFLFICQEVTWQVFLPLNIILDSPLLQRNIWFSLCKNLTQALYETLRKTFLALPKPKMLPYTPSSEKSKSWHSTSDTCPCKLVGVHPCQVSEFDPIKVKSLWLRQKNPPKPAIVCLHCGISTQFFTGRPVLTATQLHSAFRCSWNKVVLAKLQWHNEITIVLSLY